MKKKILITGSEGFIGKSFYSQFKSKYIFFRLDDFSRNEKINYSDKNFINGSVFNKTLLKKDIVALEDHPESEEIIAGVKMNFGLCPIIVLQKNSKLNIAADQLKEKGYYHTWTQADVDKIVTWRR